MTSVPHPPYLLDLTLSDFFLLLFVSLDEKSSEKKTLCQCGRGETKNVRSTKRHQNHEFQKCLNSGKNVSKVLHQMQSTLKVTLKFEYVRINTQLFINKFHFGGSPLICKCKAIVALTFLNDLPLNVILSTHSML